MEVIVDESMTMSTTAKWTTTLLVVMIAWLGHEHRGSPRFTQASNSEGVPDSLRPRMLPFIHTRK
jgi:hypothetical protein